jgi:hypothetical protein
MMTLQTKIARVGCFLVLCIFSAFGAAWRYSETQAQDFPTSELELRSDSVAQVGQPYVVDVYANVAAPAYGFGLQVKYDPAVMELNLLADADGAPVPMSITGAFAGAQRIRNMHETVDGLATIDVVYTLLPPADPVSGAGFIGRITFTVLQDAPAQLELISPRLIALSDGTAMDMPITAEPVLVVTADPALAAVAEPQVITQPETPALAPIVEVAPVPAEVAPAVETIASINTSNDVLAATNRTNTLINAVAIGLLLVVTLLLAVFAVSSMMDALTLARQPRIRPVHAYAGRYMEPQRPAPAPRQQVSQRTVQATYRANGAPMNRQSRMAGLNEPTMPSRSVQMARIMGMHNKQNRADTHDL